MKRLTVLLLFCASLSFAQSPSFPSWQEGYFDIHHISTGSGNATFFVFPDGTTLLFDAGDVDRKSRLKVPNPLKASPPLPNDAVSAAACIAGYINHVYPSRMIDYAVISHFHTDHFGSINSQSKLSSKGNYRLSGITEVNEYIPIKKIIDRNYPFYNYPVDVKTYSFDKESFRNYIDFINSQSDKKLLSVEALQAGSKNQIRLLNKPARYPSFSVRNIKSNGEVWSGDGEKVIRIIPDSLAQKDYNENPLSIALKITYGKFDYFTGGDMTGLQGFGLPGWFDTETPVAKVVGPTDALSLNHHGVRDASNEFFLKSLAPRVIVQQSWSSNHPGEEVLHRLISPALPGKRDIFATYIHEETITTYGRWLEENYLSKHGHIVIRVEPTGNIFYVYILDDITPEPKILKTFGPYESH